MLNCDWKLQRIYRTVVVLSFAFGCVLGASVLVVQYQFKFDIPKVRFSAAYKGLIKKSALFLKKQSLPNPDVQDHAAA